ncbi:MAG: hypothetical protein AAGM38_14475, partial [Pseudomonadota bacterium]
MANDLINSVNTVPSASESTTNESASTNAVLAQALDLTYSNQGVSNSEPPPYDTDAPRAHFLDAAGDLDTVNGGTDDVLDYDPYTQGARNEDGLPIEIFGTSAIIASAQSDDILDGGEASDTQLASASNPLQELNDRTKEYLVERAQSEFVEGFRNFVAPENEGSTAIQINTPGKELFKVAWKPGGGVLKTMGVELEVQTPGVFGGFIDTSPNTFGDPAERDVNTVDALNQWESELAAPAFVFKMKNPAGQRQMLAALQAALATGSSTYEALTSMGVPPEMAAGAAALIGVGAGGKMLGATLPENLAMKIEVKITDPAQVFRTREQLMEDIAQDLEDGELNGEYNGIKVVVKPEVEFKDVPTPFGPATVKLSLDGNGEIKASVERKVAAGSRTLPNGDKIETKHSYEVPIKIFKTDGDVPQLILGKDGDIVIDLPDSALVNVPLNTLRGLFDTNTSRDDPQVAPEGNTHWNEVLERGVGAFQDYALFVGDSLVTDFLNLFRPAGPYNDPEENWWINRVEDEYFSGDILEEGNHLERLSAIERDADGNWVYKDDPDRSIDLVINEYNGEWDPGLAQLARLAERGGATRQEILAAYWEGTAEPQARHQRWGSHSPQLPELARQDFPGDENVTVEHLSLRFGLNASTAVSVKQAFDQAIEEGMTPEGAYAFIQTGLIFPGFLNKETETQEAIRDNVAAYRETNPDFDGIGNGDAPVDTDGAGYEGYDHGLSFSQNVAGTNNPVLNDLANIIANGAGTEENGLQLAAEAYRQGGVPGMVELAMQPVPSGPITAGSFGVAYGFGPGGRNAAQAFFEQRLASGDTKEEAWDKTSRLSLEAFGNGGQWGVELELNVNLKLVAPPNDPVDVATVQEAYPDLNTESAQLTVDLYESYVAAGEPHDVSWVLASKRALGAHYQGGDAQVAQDLPFHILNAPVSDREYVTAVNAADQYGSDRYRGNQDAQDYAGVVGNQSLISEFGVETGIEGKDAAREALLHTAYMAMEGTPEERLTQLQHLVAQDPENLSHVQSFALTQAPKLPDQSTGEGISVTSEYFEDTLKVDDSAARALKDLYDTYRAQGMSIEDAHEAVMTLGVKGNIDGGNAKIIERVNAALYDAGVTDGFHEGPGEPTSPYVEVDDIVNPDLSVDRTGIGAGHLIDEVVGPQTLTSYFVTGQDNSVHDRLLFMAWTSAYLQEGDFEAAEARVRTAFEQGGMSAVEGLAAEMPKPNDVTAGALMDLFGVDEPTARIGHQLFDALVAEGRDPEVAFVELRQRLVDYFAIGGNAAAEDGLSQRLRVLGVEPDPNYLPDPDWVRYLDPSELAPFIGDSDSLALLPIGHTPEQGLLATLDLRHDPDGPFADTFGVNPDSQEFALIEDLELLGAGGEYTLGTTAMS